jgi:tRNA modification GTPase
MIEETLAGALFGDEPYLLQASQRAGVSAAFTEVRAARSATDPLIVAEHLRTAGCRISELLGVDHVEAMLDALFARFCVGK